MKSNKQRIKYLAVDNCCFINSDYNNKIIELSNENKANLFIDNCFISDLSNQHNGSVIKECDIFIEPKNIDDGFTNENNTNDYSTKCRGKINFVKISNPILNNSFLVSDNGKVKLINTNRYLLIEHCSIFDDNKRCYYDEYDRIALKDCIITIVRKTDKTTLRNKKAVMEISSIIESDDSDGECGGLELKKSADQLDK